MTRRVTERFSVKKAAKPILDAVREATRFLTDRQALKLLKELEAAIGGMAFDKEEDILEKEGR